MNGHWNNCTPTQPHTFKMRDAANEHWAIAACMADANECAQQHVYSPADIEFHQQVASDMERWSLQRVAFAEPNPCPVNDDGSYLQDYCKCVLPEQSCSYCREAARRRAYPDVMSDYFMDAVNPPEMSRE
jgi:hypothetical protein